MIGHPRQAGEDIPEVAVRVLAVALAGDDQRVDDGGALAGVGMADEQPVLFADRRGPDGIFDQVVVEPGWRCDSGARSTAPSVRADNGTPDPGRTSAVRVCATPGRVVAAGATAARSRAARKPARRAPISRLSQIRSQRYSRGDQPQDPLGGLRPLCCRLEEVAPGVRPAAQPHDPLALTREGRIGLIAVGLEQSLVVAQQRGEFAMPAGQPPVEDDLAPRAD